MPQAVVLQQCRTPLRKNHKMMNFRHTLTSDHEAKSLMQEPRLGMMSKTEIKKKRKAVLEHFVRGISEKVMISDVSMAAENLRQAYSYAKQIKNEENFLYCLVCYRLAHLLFRSAKSVSEMLEVHSLFREATEVKSGEIRFHSLICAIAVAHRLSEIDGIKWKECINEYINLCFDFLNTSRRHSLDFEENSSLRKLQRPLQTYSFNILEFIVYAFEADYKKLEGLSVNLATPLIHGFPTYSGWRVFSSHMDMPDVRFSEDVAESYLEEMMKNHDWNFVLKLPASKPGIIQNHLGVEKSISNGAAMCILKIIKAQVSGETGIHRDHFINFERSSANEKEFQRKLSGIYESSNGWYSLNPNVKIICLYAD